MQGLQLGIEQFQPTLPLRGATMLAVVRGFGGFISTHAPPEGSDGVRGVGRLVLVHFNPRSP